MAKKNYYDEDFKRTLVELYHNGKTQASLRLYQRWHSYPCRIKGKNIRTFLPGERRRYG